MAQLRPGHSVLEGDVCPAALMSPRRGHSTLALTMVCEWLGAGLGFVK